MVGFNHIQLICNVRTNLSRRERRGTARNMRPKIVARLGQSAKHDGCLIWVIWTSKAPNVSNHSDPAPVLSYSIVQPFMPLMAQGAHARKALFPSLRQVSSITGSRFACVRIFQAIDQSLVRHEPIWHSCQVAYRLGREVRSSTFVSAKPLHMVTNVSHFGGNVSMA
jgi:hypothetical protein